jgi:hypothetical protein
MTESCKGDECSQPLSSQADSLLPVVPLIDCETQLDAVSPERLRGCVLLSALHDTRGYLQLCRVKTANISFFHYYNMAVHVGYQNTRGWVSTCSKIDPVTCSCTAAAFHDLQPRTSKKYQQQQIKAM